MKKNTRSANTNKSSMLALLLTSGVAVCLPAVADAHVSISSGPATATKSNIVTFGVGHGCAGDDTFSVTVEIPEGVTSVRPMTSDFGTTTLVKDATQAVTSVTWQKPLEAAIESDRQYYTLVLRLKVPDAPLSTLYFKATQTCRADDGTLSVVEWTDTPDTPVAEQTGDPAAKLAIMPQRFPGWNKYTVPVAVADLSDYFGDAQIVWKDSAAFSPNPTTVELIVSSDGVSELTALGVGDVIWVKY